MERINYEQEEILHNAIIRDCLQELADIDNEDVQKSFGTLRKVNLQKKYIRGLRKFRELGVELYKKNDGIYAFYVFRREYNYSIKSRKVKRPGNMKWDIVRQNTLESILKGERE